ncbi:HdeD family acid-resistance protein [Nocardiopsis eucommiae]|uniref:HdeD family acid-resistance protein n=1 Tax=Nocardiopsis eucommiae TaxID=2831970 RepID=A0A975LA22_9ACTN|nr:HdeD family acid-resistance protein [Nocardiopsis eucommiae]
MVRYALTGNILGDLSRHWWVLVVRGVVAVVFGLVALVWPGASLLALAIIFGAFALVDGVALAFTAYRAAPGTRMPLGVQAGLSIVLGLLALTWPMAAVLAIVFLIGAWAIVTGVAEIVTAVRLRAHVSSEWLLIFVGALSVIFGLLVWFWPLAGAEAIMLVVGVYAIVFGVVMAVAGFQLRGAADGAVPTGEQDTVADAGLDGADDGTEAAERPGTETSGDADRPVSAFDEGYAGGYTDGYRGEGRDAEPDPGDDGTATPRTGRHRAPKDGPNNPGTP